MTVHTSYDTDTIYTIGYGLRPWKDLVGLLESVGVTAVVDVRSSRKSRRIEFTGPWLDSHLYAIGIESLWFGDQLGGKRAGSYHKHLATEEGENGLQRVEALADRYVVALMCAEKDVRRCHRRHIAAALEARGWTVVHL